MIDVSKFDKEFDVQELSEQAKKASENDFKKVDAGIYTVKVDKLEIGETSAQSKRPGSPMLKAQLSIVEGEFKNQKLFLNFILVPTGNDGKNFGLHNANKFLDSLDVADVSFESFKQYANLLADIMEIIEEDKLKYEVKLSYNGDFPKVEVVDVIE